MELGYAHSSEEHSPTNFLIPIAGLDHRDRASWLKLGELWGLTLVLNIVGGVLIAIIATTHGVLSTDAQRPLVDLADHLSVLLGEKPRQTGT